jgi:hypothetical protein
MQRFRLAVLLCPLVLTGCLASQVGHDGIDLRQALMALYTDQAIDNLIRAHENRPFVQLAYSQLSVTDVDKLKASAASDTVAWTGTSMFDSTKAALLQFVRVTTVAAKLPFGGSDERDRTMAFHADPITNQNAIYQRYLDFAKNESLFRRSVEKPVEPVHICRKCGCHWYWVPSDAGPAFLQLVLSTSVAIQADSTPSWSTTIVGVAPAFDQNGHAVQNRFVLTLGKDVPNDDGVMLVTLDVDKTKAVRIIGEIQAPFLPVAQKQTPMPGPLRGAPTKLLYAEYDPKQIPLDMTSLQNLPAVFVSQSFPNTPPLAAPDLQRIQDSLESIRVLVNNNNNSGL